MSMERILIKNKFWLGWMEKKSFIMLEKYIIFYISEMKILKFIAKLCLTLPQIIIFNLLFITYIHKNKFLLEDDFFILRIDQNVSTYLNISKWLHKSLHETYTKLSIFYYPNQLSIFYL